ATLAWVPCPDIPANYRRMASDCDKSGAWWFSDMPRKEGPFRMSEFAKWTHIYPKQPQPGDVIECRQEVAERFHVGEYLHDELIARGWTTRDCAQRMGGDVDISTLTLDFALAAWQAPEDHSIKN